MNSACDSSKQCKCSLGYEKDKLLGHVCNAQCSPPCVNGKCVKPELCECDPGFTKLTSPDRCVPSRSVCNLTFSKSVQHDSASDCFLLKKDLLITDGSQCKFLNGLMSPECFQAESDQTNCTLRFKCQRSANKGNLEVLCSDQSNFTAERNESVVLAATDVEWGDVTIVLSATATQEAKLDPTTQTAERRQWTLRSSEG